MQSRTYIIVYGGIEMSSLTPGEGWAGYEWHGDYNPNRGCFPCGTNPLEGLNINFTPLTEEEAITKVKALKEELKILSAKSVADITAVEYDRFLYLKSLLNGLN